jgi:hypothetical protein
MIMLGEGLSRATTTWQQDRAVCSFRQFRNEIARSKSRWSGRVGQASASDFFRSCELVRKPQSFISPEKIQPIKDLLQLALVVSKFVRGL